MRRAAIIVPGGIGSGLNGQGIPALGALVADLARSFEVRVYSLTAAAADFGPERFGFVTNADERISRRGILRMFRRIVADHRADPFDLFHGIWASPAGLMAVLLGKLLRRRSIVSLQGGEAAAIADIGYGDLLQPRRRILTKFICRAATTTVALTRFQVCALGKHGIVRPDIRVVPYGADPEKFRFVYHPPVAPIRFLHVGNLTQVKDQTALLRVFDRVRRRIDASLTIVGADYLDGRLQDEAQALGLGARVVFTGFQRHDDLPVRFADAHCLLHTSRYEGQGVVAMEAALSGTLVCATQTGIFADWRDHGFVTAPVGQPEALADKIIDVVQDGQLYEAMIRSAYRRAAHYTRAWTAAEYSALYTAS